MKTHIGFVIDRSGSMSTHAKELIPYLKQLLEDTKECSHTLALFNGRYNVVDAFNEKDYRPDGSTSLFDAIGFTVERMEKVKADRYLLFVLTDGEENTSSTYNARYIRELFYRLDKTDNWTFAFQLPKDYTYKFCSAFNIPEVYVREWEKVTEVVANTSKSMTNYLSSPQKKITFFVNTAIDIKKVKQSLKDVSDKYSVLKVGYTSPIKEFVEKETHTVYALGRAYYQLLKPEKVAANKRVLIMERGKTEIWGGSAARDLIGLPVGDDAKVKPAHLMKYDIFIESTSTNRKLQPNSLLLYEVK